MTTPGMQQEPAGKVADAADLRAGLSGVGEPVTSPASGSEALVATPRSLHKNGPKLAWHESWIIRLSIVASGILALGFAASGYFALQAISSVTNLAHDDEVASSLDLHLSSIKKIHALSQELVVLKLTPILAGENPGITDKAKVMQWLSKAQIIDAEGDMGLKIDPASDEQKAAAMALIMQNKDKNQALPVVWLDRDHLFVVNQVVMFPRGPVYDAFKSVEDIKKRYQLVGARLDDEIRPTMIRATLLIMLLSFVALASLVVVYARVFMRRVVDVLEGFREWSERDAGFRFAPVHSGELRMITQQFNAMADEVEANRLRSLYLEKIASWQVIARKLAHEIKNPLTPIQMMVGQLKRRYKGEDEAFSKLLDEAQQIISEEVAGLRRMVDNFSNFARLPEPHPKPTDLVHLARHVLELQKNAYSQHQFLFQAKSSSQMAVVDEDLLRQVLLNLTKNAAEACGQTPSMIHIRLDETAQDSLILVEDNGPGIPPEYRERIFEAYFTTKHTGPSPGMGLGLAVCQKIVLDHDGKMSVTSQPGQTVFTIRIPKQRKRP